MSKKYLIKNMRDSLEFFFFFEVCVVGRNPLIELGFSKPIYPYPTCLNRLNEFTY